MKKFYSTSSDHWVRLSSINEISVEDEDGEVLVVLRGKLGDDNTGCTISCSNRATAQDVAKNILSACEKDALVTQHPLMVLDSTKHLAAEIAESINAVKGTHL